LEDPVDLQEESQKHPLFSIFGSKKKSIEKNFTDSRLYALILQNFDVLEAVHLYQEGQLGPLEHLFANQMGTQEIMRSKNYF